MINGQDAELDVLRDGPMLKMVGGGKPFGPKAKELIIGQRFRDRGLSGGMVDEVMLVRRAVSDLEAMKLYNPAKADAALADDPGLMWQYYLSAVDGQARQARAELEEKRKQFV